MGSGRNGEAIPERSDTPPGTLNPMPSAPPYTKDYYPIGGCFSNDWPSFIGSVADGTVHVVPGTNRVAPGPRR